MRVECSCGPLTGHHCLEGRQDDPRDETIHAGLEAREGNKLRLLPGSARLGCAPNGGSPNGPAPLDHHKAVAPWKLG